MLPPQMHLFQVVTQLRVLAQQQVNLARFYQGAHHILVIALQQVKLVMVQLLIFHQVALQLLVTVLLLVKHVMDQLPTFHQDVLQVKGIVQLRDILATALKG